MATLVEEVPITSRERPALHAWYALGTLVVAALFGAVDRQILVLVTEPLKQDIGLADVQIGLLQGVGPGLFAALGAVLLGWLADRTARQVILAVCVLAWSAATAACGLAQSFDQLFVATIAIALGEAALAPVLYSLVPDLFPGKSRMTANFILFGAITIGAGFGISLSGAAMGWLDSHRASLPAQLQQLATWRLAFLAAAVPGIPIAIAVLAIGPVQRLLAAGAAATAIGSVTQYFKEHWRALAGLYFAAAFYGIAQYAAYAWTPVYIMRVLGATPSAVGVGVGAALTTGSIAGVCLAPVAARLLNRRFGPMTSLRIYHGAMAVYLVLVLLQLAVDSPWQAYTVVALQTAVGTAGAALMPALLQDISPVLIRARVIAFGTAFFACAIAAAPVLVGGVSDSLARYPRGLLWALVIVSAPAIAAGVLLLSVAQAPIRRTIETFAPVPSGESA